jgi:hypothetical protein
MALTITVHAFDISKMDPDFIFGPFSSLWDDNLPLGHNIPCATQLT